MKKFTSFVVLAAMMAVLLSLSSCVKEPKEKEPENTTQPETPTVYYTVKFDSKGGSNVETQKIESGKKATKPTNPTKAAIATEIYTFNNWYTSADEGVTLADTAYDFDTPVTSDITLYAKWNTIAAYSITINEMTNGAVSASKTSGIAEGETITLTITPADYYDLETISADSNVTLNGTDNTRTFVMPASNVTISATFYRRWIGKKGADVAKEVGDIVFNDGSATPYSEFKEFDEDVINEKKKSAIALIFYKGTGLNNENNTTTSRTLGIGLKHNRDSYYSFMNGGAQAFSKLISNNACLSEGSAGSYTFTGDINGSDNFEQIAAFEGVTDTGSNFYYPAFHFAKDYKDKLIGSETESRILSGSEYENGWYIPSIAELFQIYVNGFGTNKAIDLEAASIFLDGDQFGIKPSTCVYWSSSQVNNPSLQYYNAYYISFKTGNVTTLRANQNSCYVLVIREFN